jgi:hypothetical protein
VLLGVSGFCGVELWPRPRLLSWEPARVGWAGVQSLTSAVEGAQAVAEEQPNYGTVVDDQDSDRRRGRRHGRRITSALAEDSFGRRRRQGRRVLASELASPGRDHPYGFATELCLIGTPSGHAVVAQFLATTVAVPVPLANEFVLMATVLKRSPG